LLQQLAEPGTTLISHATRQAVEGHVALERTTIDVGGEAASRVGRAATARLTWPPRLMQRLEPFVGRVHEFGLLANLATQARAGRGQLAGVVGEPGIGKSRLLLEFTNAMPDFTILEARCVSYGSLVPYSPLADLVRAYCGVKDGDSADDAIRAVRTATTAAAVPADADRWLLRLFGAGDTTDDSVSPEAIKARTFDVLRALLFHASTLRPLVIVIEDIHWIDRTSEEFLALIVERVVAARMLIVVTFRPGYHPPWRDRSYVTQLTLTALTVADSEALIGAIARETRIPPQVSAEILAKAEGNPFFLEELTRAVLEHGPDDRVPDTVHGVIMARIDRLPDTAKQLLQTAAVLGREVRLRLLTRVWRGTQRIAPELEELCRLEFLFEKSGGDEQVFVFRHALTQDVAYDSLLARQRRDLHLAAARALEELYGSRIDEMTATLAYHYARTDLTDEAVTWLDACRRSGGARLRECGSHPASGHCAATSGTAPSRRRARPPDAGRGAPPCALTVFPRAFPRERRRAATARRALDAARRPWTDGRVLFLAGTHVQPPWRSAARNRQRVSRHRCRDERRRSGDAWQGARPARARRPLGR
jgi:hypothetical protein